MFNGFGEMALSTVRRGYCSGLIEKGIEADMSSSQLSEDACRSTWYIVIELEDMGGWRVGIETTEFLVPGRVGPLLFPGGY
jgi:hypothetical protein